MRFNIFQIAIIFLLVLSVKSLSAQSESGLRCELRDHELVIVLDKRASPSEINLFLKEMNLSGLHVDSLFNHEVLNKPAAEDWQVRRINRHVIELFKISALENIPAMERSDILEKVDPHRWHTFEPNLNVAFGVNNFRNQPSVYDLEDGTTVFTLQGYQDASSVHVSGSFNEWRPGQLPMQKRNGVWEVRIRLSPGKHLYKFIVNGKDWIYDTANFLRESDTYSNYNSVYFKSNIVFHAETIPRVKRMAVTGSFNGWSRRGIPMEKTAGGWKLSMYLREGTHTYKFIADRKWILDPSNPETSQDGLGNTNSVVSIGDPVFFKLVGFEHAQEVFVAGNFNHWNFSELRMEKTESGWIRPYVLGAGNYEYKYRIDGQYLIDPNNPHTAGQGDYLNSVLSVGDVHEFRLSGYTNAKNVSISGTFNHWHEQGYRMQRDGDDWVIKVHLSRGKQMYKFIVDGHWIHDPDNPHYQTNEHGTYNSIIWVDAL